MLFCRCTKGSHRSTAGLHVWSAGCAGGRGLGKSMCAFCSLGSQCMYSADGSTLIWRETHVSVVCEIEHRACRWRTFARIEFGMAVAASFWGRAVSWVRRWRTNPNPGPAARPMIFLEVQQAGTSPGQNVPLSNRLHHELQSRR